MFSKLKYVNAPNFKEFREQWQAKYLDGLVVHSKAFDGLKGDFPIGFLVWESEQEGSDEWIKTKALDRSGEIVGEKVFYKDNEQQPLSDGFVRPRSNKQDALPLKKCHHTHHQHQGRER